jgi:TadE-like protein
MKRLVRKLSAARFAKGEDGVVMTEALVAVPFLFLLSVGVLEFGAVLWEREQIQTGLRDAARYMARCREPVACEANAQNLAYYSDVYGGGSLRVPGWDAVDSPIVFTTAGDGITATTTHQMVTSPLFGVLNIDGISVTLAHTQRRIGW